jgi:hypothetical protein
MCYKINRYNAVTQQSADLSSEITDSVCFVQSKFFLGYESDYQTAMCLNITCLLYPSVLFYAALSSCLETVYRIHAGLACLLTGTYCDHLYHS